MQKYRALISYVGTRYRGWQKQKGSGASAGPSVQETIEKALARMTGENVGVVGSGRTDSGVHAAGQVAHFVLQKRKWETGVLHRGLNGILPQDIRVLEVTPAELDFHAQRSAVKKQYSYYFQQGPAALPFLEPYAWWIKKTLDIRAMRKALRVLRGEHDFKSFQSSGARPGPTVRRIIEAAVTREAVAFPAAAPALLENLFFLVRIRVVGTGFLKQMVRGMAGTLLQIGEGRRPPECMKDILHSRSRKLVGPTAPGRALWLEKVWYEDV
ncbi:MAG: tRNA pseudouridine(38-40) synthase TruA [Bdellovibrionales bacterium RIFOXYD1_FULL_53_11]|nr:MAG: tRNA pseudouridine(38-40) synthase TruA [Bdellovibrionales bacterium RIFOXYD1_FULL_53_11]